MQQRDASSLEICCNDRCALWLGLKSAMLFVAIAILGFCLLVGFMPDEIVKLLLVGSWAGMALLAVGATIYSVLLLLLQ